MFLPNVRSLVAGLAGAVTVTALHQAMRGSVPAAPRLDSLGMQSVAKAFLGFGARPPAPPDLYRAALGGDLVANSMYYGLAAGTSRPLEMGALLGLAAGLGAAFLPDQLGLDASAVRRTPQTAMMTIGLYTAGGLAAGAVARLMAEEKGE